MGGKLKTEIVRSSSKFDTLKQKNRVYVQYYTFEKQKEGIDIIAVDHVEYLDENDPTIYTVYSWRSWHVWSRVSIIPVDVWQEATARFDTYE